MAKCQEKLYKAAKLTGRVGTRVVLFADKVRQYAPASTDGIVSLVIKRDQRAQKHSE
jgi:hypothetical protein